MTRREAIRNTIGALVGVSAIPAALEKPPFTPCVATSDRIPYTCWTIWSPEGELLKRVEYGTPPSPEKIREMIKNFKANMHDCWA